MEQPGATPVLLMRDIRKSYGSFKALRGISMAVAPREFVGLLGPNGAGKSTLFQVATGLFAPDGGDLELFGTTYRQNGRDILRQLGVVFQARSIDLEMTVLANLRFHGALFGLSGGRLKDRIATVAELLGIADSLKKQVRTLSGGNQRRVEIARALLNEPRLLLMDEPSAGLDATTRRGLVGHMKSIRDMHGTSILWATHLVDEVDSADRIVLIAEGSVIDEGSPSALMARTSSGSLTDAYVALVTTPAAAE